MKKRLLSMILAVVLLAPLGVSGASAAAVPTVTAAAAIVIDFQTGEIYYEKDIDTPRPIASMTKLMTLYLVFEEIEAGRLSLDDSVTVSSYAAWVSANPEYYGSEGFRTGQRYKVDTMIKMIMTSSCCAPVVVLAEQVAGTEPQFVELMNAKAAQWGIDARFADSTGVENEGNAVTARAVAYIARRLIRDYPIILEYSSLRSTTVNGRTYRSTNTLMLNGQVEGIDGLKTGTTSLAGYCFTGTAERNGRRIISVVMGAPGKTSRNNQSKALLEYGFACRAEREALWASIAGSVSGTILCEGGTVYPYITNRAGVTFSGMSGEMEVALHWELNGLPLGESAPFVLKNGAAAETEFAIPTGAEAAMAAVLTFPDGTQARCETVLPTHTQPLSFTGRLGVRQVELYPEMSLDIPFTGRCDQGLAITVPAAWYLDGAPLPGYRNDSFSFSPAAGSRYELCPGALPPGRHTLELRVNPDGIPGVDQASFSVEIVVLDSAA